MKMSAASAWPCIPWGALASQRTWPAPLFFWPAMNLHGLPARRFRWTAAIARYDRTSHHETRETASLLNAVNWVSRYKGENHEPMEEVSSSRQRGRAPCG